eukprot:212252_1
MDTDEKNEIDIDCEDNELEKETQNIISSLNETELTNLKLALSNYIKTDNDEYNNAIMYLHRVIKHNEISSKAIQKKNKPLETWQNNNNMNAKDDINHEQNMKHLQSHNKIFTMIPDTVDLQPQTTSEIDKNVQNMINEFSDEELNELKATLKEDIIETKNNDAQETFEENPSDILINELINAGFSRQEAILAFQQSTKNENENHAHVFGAKIVETPTEIDNNRNVDNAKPKQIEPNMQNIKDNSTEIVDDISHLSEKDLPEAQNNDAQEISYGLLVNELMDAMLAIEIENQNQKITEAITISTETENTENIDTEETKHSVQTIDVNISKQLSDISELSKTDKERGSKLIFKIFRNILKEPNNAKYHSLKIRGIQKKLG